jgi:hypothetical protein
LLGAGISTMLVYFPGLFWRPGALVVGLLAVILGLGRIFFPDNLAAGGFKVPRHWEAWGASRYLGVFGVFLGMGFVTTMPSSTMVVLIAWMWHLHVLGLILITFEAFALGRIVTTASAIAGRKDPGDSPARADMAIRRMSYLPRVEAATSIALGAALLAFGA